MCTKPMEYQLYDLQMTLPLKRACILMQDRARTFQLYDLLIVLSLKQNQQNIANRIVGFALKESQSIFYLTITQLYDLLLFDTPA